MLSKLDLQLTCGILKRANLATCVLFIFLKKDRVSGALTCFDEIIMEEREPSILLT